MFLSAVTVLFEIRYRRSQYISVYELNTLENTSPASQFDNRKPSGCEDSSFRDTARACKGGAIFYLRSQQE